jgi:hypothetical protein
MHTMCSRCWLFSIAKSTFFYSTSRLRLCSGFDDFSSLFAHPFIYRELSFVAAIGDFQVHACKVCNKNSLISEIGYHDIQSVKVDRAFASKERRQNA